MPALHILHPEALTAAHVPALHELHTAAPGPDQVPALQLEQELDPNDENVPPPQVRHLDEDVARMVAEYVPALHDVQI